MGSLNDSSDVGARPVGGPTYGANRTGPGRWAEIPDRGVLWTNDSDSLQLGYRRSADRVEANAIRAGLTALAAEGVTVTEAFDRLVARFGATVQTGELSELR